jgi:hypothetical protein
VFKIFREKKARTPPARTPIFRLKFFPVKN